MRRLVPLLLVSTLFSSFAAAQNMPLNRGRWTQVEGRMIGYPTAATMLADGRVFIAGATNRTYLFDPATNRLTLGPFDHIARGYLTATRLPDGRVLLAGGDWDDPTCTIFDPATNRITATAPLLHARTSHTATLLPNGKVLVAGGFRPFTGMTTCEIFDPASGTWEEAGPLKIARNTHTATLLPNGRILFAGGDDWNATTFSAELYDPATMTSAVIGTFPGKRREHTAVTVPDGRVYLLGAFFDDASDETAVDIYDPATNTLTPVAMRIFAPLSRTAGLLQDGRILIAGNVPGVTFPDWSTTPYQPRCVLLDPISGKATIANATQKIHHRAAVVLQDGRMLLLGGQAEPAIDETMAELFDPNAPGPRGDYTRDGTSDILWYQPSTRRKVVWRMNGLAAAASGIAPMRECLRSPNHLAAALDVDGGGRMDGLFFDGYNLTYALDLVPSRCGEVCGAMLADWSVAATADFDGDGREDVLLRRANGEVAMSLMTRPGRKSYHALSGQILTIISDANWIIAAADDFDGDGYADILWRHLGSGENYVWFMNGFTVERAGHTAPVTDMNYSVAGTGDFDGNGKADIVWRSVDGPTRIWFMNGVTITNDVAVPAPGAGWNVAVIGDFDADGKSDVFWRNATTGENAVTLFDGYNVKASSSLPPVTEAGWVTFNP